MRPHVCLQLADGSTVECEHGDLVGRVWSAAVWLDDPRVSEAHAMVSLRDGEFYLLALRRMLVVDGQVVSAVRLRPGVSVALADGLAVTVTSIALPETVLSIEATGFPRVILPGVCSVTAVPRPKLVGRYEPEAPCVIWCTGDQWRLRLQGETRLIASDDAFTLDGVTFTIHAISTAISGPGVTIAAGGVQASLKIIVAYDSVQIHREDDPIVLLNGVQARIISELAQFGRPAPWQLVAREVWPDEVDTRALRKRWDVSLTRLRAKLRVARVRPDLIVAHGTGNIELVLRGQDVVEDRS